MQLQRILTCDASKVSNHAADEILGSEQVKRNYHSESLHGRGRGRGRGAAMANAASMSTKEVRLKSQNDFHLLVQREEQQLTKGRRKATDKEQKDIKRKVGCRLSQRRFRTRLVQKTHLLETQVYELKQRLNRLHEWKYTLTRDLKHRLLAAQGNRADRAKRTVEDYFALFQNGLFPKEGLFRAKQMDYLTTQYSSDMRLLDQSIKGRELFIHQMDLYRLIMGNFVMTRVDVCTRGTDPLIVQSFGVISFCLSRKSIAMLCPSLFCNERCVQKLIGQTLHLGVHATYYFNGEGKVCRLDPIGDYLGAFRNLLGDCDNLSMVLSSLLMSEEGLVTPPNKTL